MTHTNSLMDAWEVWVPVMSVQAGRVLKGWRLMQCGNVGRGVGECKEMGECCETVPKMRVFSLVLHLIKLLLLKIRSGSCCINIIQSKGKQREDGCLLI